MKLNNGIKEQIGAGSPAIKACVECCRKALALIENVKSTIYADFKGTLGAHEQMLRLALNEAEALAWQTAYPQLVFATLAAEKAQAVADWNRHQQGVARNYVAERHAVRR